MDIEPPEHPIHSWRDFFVHIATIVVGLLIAIGLEQAVESIHHRHLVHTAREQIRVEIEQNQKTAEEDRRFLQAAGKSERFNLELLSNVDPLAKPLTFGWEWSAPDSSAWATAQQTGALTFMPYDEVQQLSSVYIQQALVQEEASRYIHSYTQGLAPALRRGDLHNMRAGDLTPAAREALSVSTAQDIAELGELLDLLTGLGQQYDQQLKQSLP